MNNNDDIGAPDPLEQDNVVEQIFEEEEINFTDPEDEVKDNLGKRGRKIEEEEEYPTDSEDEGSDIMDNNEQDGTTLLDNIPPHDPDDDEQGEMNSVRFERKDELVTLTVLQPGGDEDLLKTLRDAKCFSNEEVEGFWTPLIPRSVRGVPYIGRHRGLNGEMKWPVDFKLHVYKRLSPEDKMPEAGVSGNEFQEDGTGTDNNNEWVLTTVNGDDPRHWFYIRLSFLKTMLLGDGKERKPASDGLYEPLWAASENPYGWKKNHPSWGAYDTILEKYEYCAANKVAVEVKSWRPPPYKPPENECVAVTAVITKRRTELSGDLSKERRKFEQFQRFCVLASNAQRGIVQPYNCHARAWNGQVSDVELYFRANPECFPDVDDLKGIVRDVRVGKSRILNLKKAPKDGGEVKETVKVHLLHQEDWKDKVAFGHERPSTDYKLVSNHLLNFYALYVKKSALTRLDDAGFIMGRLRRSPTLKEGQEAHDSLKKGSKKAEENSQKPGRYSKTSKTGSKAESKAKAHPEKYTAKTTINTATSPKTTEAMTPETTKATSLMTTAITLMTTETKMKADFDMPQEMTVTSLSTGKIDDASECAKLVSRNQNTLMGGKSAFDIVEKWWNVEREDRSAEWLHRSGFALGALGEGKQRGWENAQKSQVYQNIVLGTYEANTLMLRYETSLKHIIRLLAERFKSVVKRSKLPPSVNVGDIVFGRLQTEARPYDQQAATHVYNSRECFSEGKWRWFAPKLDWVFTIVTLEEFRTQLEENFGTNEAVFDEIYEEVFEPVLKVKPSGRFKRTFWCFSQDDALRLEILVDREVEYHILKVGNNAAVVLEKPQTNLIEERQKELQN